MVELQPLWEEFQTWVFGVVSGLWSLTSGLGSFLRVLIRSTCACARARARVCARARRDVCGGMDNGGERGTGIGRLEEREGERS